MKQFFCESCGKSVQERDDICPHCGAFFVALRCPRCGFQAKRHRFAKGCPNCGYLSDQLDPFRPLEPHDGAAQKRRPVPGWVFWLAVGALAVSMLVLSIVYVRL